MRRQEAVPLFTILALTIAALVYTLVAGNVPLLGLDLQGGISVVLQPDGEATDDELDQSISIMRKRVDALGVAEPEVSRQGNTILVQLPGVEDPQRALALIGQTAEMRFRPALEVGVDAPLTEREDDLPDAEVVLAEIDPDTGVETRYRLGPTALTGSGLVTANALYNSTSFQWTVGLEFVGGAEGIDGFNAVSRACHAQEDICPTRIVAIVIDGEIVSAPLIQPTAPVFEPFRADQVSISGSFTQESAQDLALGLRFGALPVQLETQEIRTVSATIGRDALDAGIAAGIVGVIIVAMYMIAYYRLLGVVAMVSLAVSFGLLWAIVSWLGSNQGLALTLAGVTGLIVSIGVSVDSNIVYFENVKEDVREGRPVRSSVERSFTSAFSTIVKADVSTLIGAGLLYWLTIGPVRGFAFFLGLATILDLIVSYFLMKPMVIALGRSRRLQDKPRWLGIPVAPAESSGAAIASAPIPAGGGA